MAGNVHKSELSVVRLPDIAQEEDRGLKRCGTPNLVLADISDNSRYRNDITRVSFKVDELTVELEKENGEVIPAVGLPIEFPYQANAKGFMIDWRQLTKTPSGGGTILDSQCYKVKITYELAGTSGEFYFGAYKLMPFNQITSRDTVQVFTVLNDVVRSIGINYKDSGFAGSVRFKGTFGYMQPNFETNNITYADRTRNKVRIEALRSYELRTSQLVGCMTSQIDEQHLLAANQIWITEHHPHAHIQYNQFPVILSEDASPKIEYLAGGYAKLTAQFKDKVAVHESKYDGNIESKINASFDLPQGVQSSGCANGQNNIQQSDGTLIQAVTVPSGSTVNSPVADSVITQKDTANNILNSTNVKATDPADIVSPDATYSIKDTDASVLYSGNILSAGILDQTINDSTVNVRKSDNVLIQAVTVKAEDLEDYNVADSPITVNNAPLTNLKATDSLDIPVHNTAGSDVGTVAVGVYGISDTTITLNTNEVTDNVLAEGSKNYNLVDQIGRAVPVQSVAGDDVTLATKSGTRNYKTGQDVIVVAGDDGETQRGAGVDWYNLSNPNFFGHTKRFSGTTGGYWEESDSTYRDVNGAVTTNALAFPEDIVLDWSQFDIETGDVYGIYRVLNNVDVDYSSNETYVTGLSTASWSGFVVPNIDELWRWAWKSNQGAAVDRALLYEPLITNNVAAAGLGQGSFRYWSSTIQSDLNVKTLENNYSEIINRAQTFSTNARSVAIRIFNTSEL